MIRCSVCGKEMLFIAYKHLKKHGLTSQEYVSLYGAEFCSDEYREKMSKRVSGHLNPFFGKRHSDHTKKKISDILKAKGIKPKVIWTGFTRSRFTSERVKEMHRTGILKGSNFVGRHHTKESKEKIANANRGVARRPEVRKQISDSLRGHIPWNKGCLLSEATKEKIRQKRLEQRLPTRDTLPEKMFEGELISRSIKGWVKHKSIFNWSQPDFVFLNEKIAVYIDGCYWHCCPIHFPEAKTYAQKQNFLRDRKIPISFFVERWHAFRFWEHEIYADVNECVNLLSEVVRSRRNGK